MPEFKWKPIERIPDEFLNFSDQELRDLTVEWQNIREQLDESQVTDLNNKLAREWAIETGKIERIYDLDEGTTQVLIERGIEASLINHNSTNLLPEKTADHIIDQKNVIDWLFDFVANRRELSILGIQDMHILFTKNQGFASGIDQFGNRVDVPLIKGDWKTQLNNPIQQDGTTFEYCPPLQVQNEMENLISWFKEYENLEIQPEALSSWIHHRFTLIHPFQDGNGRVARALATLVFLKARLLPLVVVNKDKPAYLDAIRAADVGRFGDLVRYFSKIQKDRLFEAIKIVQDVLIDYPEVVSRNDLDKVINRNETASKLVLEFKEVSNREFVKVQERLLPYPSELIPRGYQKEFIIQLQTKINFSIDLIVAYKENYQYIEATISCKNNQSKNIIHIEPEINNQIAILQFRSWLKQHLQQFLVEIL